MVIHQQSRRLLKMDILMSETCWAHNKWNKITSGIKLAFHSSTKMYKICGFFFFFSLWRSGPTRARASSFLKFLNHTQQRITRRRELYLTTHDTHNKQTSMPPGGIFFEPFYCSLLNIPHCLFIVLCSIYHTVCLLSFAQYTTLFVYCPLLNIPHCLFIPP